jgi:hypothetical protein
MVVRAAAIESQAKRVSEERFGGAGFLGMGNILPEAHPRFEIFPASTREAGIVRR